MIELVDNKYGLILFRLIKVYMIKGTLEEQWQTKITVTQPTGILTTFTFILTAIPQPINTFIFTPSVTA